LSSKDKILSEPANFRGFLSKPANLNLIDFLPNDLQFSENNNKLDRRTLDDFLQKWRTTGSIKHTAGSGRPRSSRTVDNTEVIKIRYS